MKEEIRISKIDKEIKALEKERKELQQAIRMRDSIELNIKEIDFTIEKYKDEQFKIVFLPSLNRFALYSRRNYKNAIQIPFKYEDEKKASKWLSESKYKDICIF